MDSYPTPESTQKSASNESSSLRRSTRSTLSAKKHLKYDQHYHPLDQVLRPSNARKRRKVHEISSSEDDLDDYVNDEEDDEEESDESKDGEPSSPYQPSKANADNVRRSPLGWRKSERRKAAKPIYNENVHPQDEVLREAGVSLARWRKRKPVRSRKKPAMLIEDLDEVAGNTETEDLPDVVDLVEAESSYNDQDADPAKGIDPKDDVEREEISDEWSQTGRDHSNAGIDFDLQFSWQSQNDERLVVEEDFSSHLDDGMQLSPPHENYQSRIIIQSPQSAYPEVAGGISREPLTQIDANIFRTEPSPPEISPYGSKPQPSKTKQSIENESNSDLLIQQNENSTPSTSQQTHTLLGHRYRDFHTDEPLFAVYLTLDEINSFFSSMPSDLQKNSGRH